MKKGIHTCFYYPCVASSEHTVSGKENDCINSLPIFPFRFSKLRKVALTKKTYIKRKTQASDHIYSNCSRYFPNIIVIIVTREQNKKIKLGKNI